MKSRKVYFGIWLILTVLVFDAASASASPPKTPAFHAFETKVCGLLEAQNREAALSLNGFYELLYQARSTEDPGELHKTLVAAAKDWKAVTDSAAKYNRLLYRVKPPTSGEKRVWAARHRVELSVIKLSRRQQSALFGGDLDAYEALQPHLEAKEHMQQRLFDRIGISCE